MIDFNKVLENIFGPLLEYMFSKHINVAFIFLIPFIIWIYRSIIKRRKKWKDLDYYDKYGIILFVFLLILCIIVQIDMIDKAMRGH